MSPARVLSLQRTAGNAAVIQLLRGPAVHVQRQDPATEEETEQLTVDEQTFDGFETWAEASIADADDACVEGQETANRLSSPYQERLNMLIAGVVDVRNQVANGVDSLRAGGAAPDITADPQGMLLWLDEETFNLMDVTEAWDDVMGSGLLELMASIGEAQVARARRLRDELRACERELRDLERIASGSEMRGAFLQTGGNAAISIALAAITIANPIAGIVVAVGAAAVQLTIDHYLGPSSPGADTFGAATVSTAGSAMQQLGPAGSALRRAGGRLGTAGAIAGTTIDVLETREAIAQYEAAAGRLRAVGSRFDRLSRELQPLLPLLQYPRTANALIAGLRARAETLRENGQVVLSERGQL
jgi:hypothetical protein